MEDSRLKAITKLAQIKLSGTDAQILFALLNVSSLSCTQIQKVTKIGNLSHVSRSLHRLVSRLIVTKNGNFFAFNTQVDQWKLLPKLVIKVTKIGNSVKEEREETKETEKEKESNKEKEKEKEKKEEKEETRTRLKPRETQDKRNSVLQAFIEFAHEYSFPYQGSREENRQYAWLLIQRHGVEKAQGAVIAAIHIRGLRFAPVISDFKALYYKFGDLEAFFHKQQNNLTVEVG